MSQCDCEECLARNRRYARPILPGETVTVAGQTVTNGAPFPVTATVAPVYGDEVARLVAEARDKAFADRRAIIEGATAAIAEARRDAYQRAIEIVDSWVQRDGDRNDAIAQLRALRDAP